MTGIAMALMVVFPLFFVGFIFQAAQAQGPAPVPTSDGVTLDQGIAYGLMLLALALTYLIH